MGMGSTYQCLAVYRQNEKKIVVLLSVISMLQYMTCTPFNFSEVLSISKTDRLCAI